MQSRQQLSISLAWMLAVSLAGVTGVAGQESPQKNPLKDLSADARRELVARAKVWMPVSTASLDLRAGPSDAKAVPPNGLVTCTYVQRKSDGNTPKFYCSLNGENNEEDDVVKVKYGRDNGEVYGEVLATRLLWALGFGADHIYPVRVTCEGCSSDPWNSRAPLSKWTFDPAALEPPSPHKALETKGAPGWTWSELDLIDEAKGGASTAQRDALKLLAVFIQHTDSKPQQQRLVCLPGGKGGEDGCEQPFMMLNDVGLTFGEASKFNSNTPSAVNFDNWAKLPVWNDAAQCIGNLKKSNTGTLENPQISEAGRAFLAGLLKQLSDQQLHDLFEVARVELRSRKPGSTDPPASVNEWVEAFKQKREAIAAARCPA